MGKKKDKGKAKKKKIMKDKPKPKPRRKGAKRSFYEVSSGLTATKVHVYGFAPEDFEGRHVKLDMTRSLKGRGFELKLKVKVNDGKLEGEPRSLVLAGSYVRRMMRKGSDYVEDSFETESRDGKVRVKPFLITRKKVSRAVRRELRNKAKEFIEKHIKTRTSEEIFKELMANKLQKDLSLKLKKVYPLSLCEIRWFEIVGEKEVGDASEKKTVKKVEEDGREDGKPLA